MHRNRDERKLFARLTEDIDVESTLELERAYFWATSLGILTPDQPDVQIISIQFPMPGLNARTAGRSIVRMECEEPEGEIFGEGKVHFSVEIESGHLARVEAVRPNGACAIWRRGDDASIERSVVDAVNGLLDRLTESEVFWLTVGPI